MVLVGHFFNVALHGVKHALAGLPTPQRFRRAYDLLHVACCIIMPMIVSVSRHPSLCPPLSLCENRARVRVGVRVCVRVCVHVCVLRRLPPASLHLCVVQERLPVMSSTAAVVASNLLFPWRGKTVA